MPLPLLLVLVVVGIAAITLLVRWLSPTPPLTFDNKETAAAAWLREFPDRAPKGVLLSEDGKSALVVLTRGSGLVWAMGADSTARGLAGATVEPSRHGLVIRLRDFASPAVRVQPGPAQDDWVRRITGAAP